MSAVSDLMKGWMDQLDQGRSADDIVACVDARFRTATGKDRYELARVLQTFLVIARREEKVLQLLDQMMEEFPDDIQLPMNKAEAYLYGLRDFLEALKWINVAIERADRQGRSQREARGCKARVLLKLGRGEELSDVLEEIMALRLDKGAFDVGRERDFIDRAPAGLIRKDVLDRYNEFRPKRPTDSLEDMPPRYGPPEESL